MTKKILLLVLSLPLILMICLFTTSNTVSLAISIPVDDIKITSEKIVYLDMSQNETYKVEYEITPLNAANKKVSFKTQKVEGQKEATLEFKDGTIIPKTSGTVDVLVTTVDGGHFDKLRVIVSSTSIEEIKSTVSKNQIYVGDDIDIVNEFIPNTTANKTVKYESSDLNVLEVDSNGNVKGVGKGTAKIKVISNANPEVYDEVEIIVLNKDLMDLSYINKTWNDSVKINISVDSKNVNYNISTKVFINNIEQTNPQIQIKDVENEEGKHIATFKFDEGFVGKVKIEFTIVTSLGLTLTKTCEIEKVKEVDVSFNQTEIPSFVQGTKGTLAFALSPSDAINDVNVKCKVSANNDNVVPTLEYGVLLIDAKKAGITTITFEIEVDGILNSTKSASIDIVVKPSTINISESANSYGDEQLLTIGRTDINYNVSTFKFNLSYNNSNKVDSTFLENISWVSSDEAVIINKNGELQIIDEKFEGIVEIYALYSYKTFKQQSAPFSIRCVGNGINVDCYEDLLKASKEELPIILHNNIVDDFGYCKDGTKMSLDKVFTTIQTTYDKTYYENLYNNGLLNTSLEEACSVKVLLSFKNAVYGNGNVINAHNIAYGLDNTGSLKDEALFRGPLNFVAVTETGASAVSVKGQDNICFALYEGASLNNIKLKGCTLDSGKSDKLELNDLTYVGTVVEVLGDNVSVNYCRISNGRIIMRIFGDVSDPEKVINVDINNSILSSAREFIIRMGSNCFVQGTKNNTSPFIDPNDRLTFPNYMSYSEKSDDAKDSYDEKYIKTFVNVKNCAFKDCGIFTFGLDSHFSGELLANGRDYVKDMPSLKSLQELFIPWYDLAKTSYGAKLTFEGDVRIYDWKKVDSIDSSTLIDISIKNGKFDDIFKRLTFDVKELVNIAGSKENFKDIIVNYNGGTYDGDGEKYVHGGIAFFGGGKNYCCFEDNRTEPKYTLNGYTVSLADVDSSYLNLAAGNESFYFLLHDANEKNFTPAKQDEILANDATAFDFVFKK